jgi:hypothetical protein
LKIKDKDLSEYIFTYLRDIDLEDSDDDRLDGKGKNFQAVLKSLKAM